MSTHANRRRPPSGRASAFSTGTRAAPRPRAPFIRRYRAALLAGVAGVIVVAAGVIFALKFGPSSAGKEQAAGNLPADPAVVAALTGVPASTFDAVGAGTSSNPPKSISAPALAKDGKPELLYVGAEYCPYCAAERWAVIAALSRFGSFSNLYMSRSSASDVYANTPTFTFYGATYTSQYVSFDAVEQYTSQPSGSGGYTHLQSLNSTQQAVVSQFDQPPYTSSQGGIPFVDFGGTAVMSGATYDPSLLSGKDWSQIALALADPSTPLAKAVDGSANLLTAAICRMTGGQPGNVCTSAGVTAAAQRLAK